MWKGKLSRQDEYKIIEFCIEVLYSTMGILSSVLTILSNLLQNTEDKKHKKKQTNLY